MTCCTRAVKKGLARYTLMKPGFTASRRSTTSEDGKAAMIFCVVGVRRSSTDMRGVQRSTATRGGDERWRSLRGP